MHILETWQIGVMLALIGYIACCFGLLAWKHGRNPFLWGLLSVISPINMTLLGYWAATGRLPGGSSRGTARPRF